MKTSHKIWTDEEIEILKDMIQDGGSCEDVAEALKRTVRSVQHKFNELGLKKPVARVGDIINGWKIMRVYLVQTGSQQIRMADIESVINDKRSSVRLTKLTNKQIGWPDRRRPDVIERNKTHGESSSRLYRIWAGMKSRCLNEKQLSYEHYGARGVSICSEWLDKYENFRDWAKANGYTDELTLDRINVDGNYCPDNCQWVTYEEQGGNKRNSDHTTITAFGEVKTIIEWSHDPRCNIGLTGLRYRVHAGWNPEEAITKPTERKAITNNLESWLQQKYPHIYNEFVAG